MTRRYRLLGRHVVPDRFLSCLRRILLQCSTILQGLLSTPPPTSRATFCNFTSHFDNHVNCSITWQSCHSDSKLSQRATKSESSVCDSHICGDSSSSCCSNNNNNKFISSRQVQSVKQSEYKQRVLIIAYRRLPAESRDCRPYNLWLREL